jgi:toxin ParE1/3/4
MIIVWSEPAKADFDAILDHPAQENPLAALNVIAMVERRTSELVNLPHLGSPANVGDSRKLTLSRWPYLLIYDVRGGTIRILRVWHAAQNWQNTVI